MIYRSSFNQIFIRSCSPTMSPAYAARHRHRPPDARRSPAAGARLHYTLTRLWTRTASVRGKTRATRPACQRPQALHADPGPGALALHAWLMYANRKFARSPIRIPQNCDQNAISRSTQRRIFILKVCSDVSRYISTQVQMESWISQTSIFGTATRPDRLGSDSAPLASAAAGFSVPAQLFAT